MAQLNCVVVTPEKTALDEQADFVALPMFDGEAGISPGHSPLIGRLGYGEMRLRVDGQVRRFYIDGGFVQVSGDVVSVLTGRAIPSEEVDARGAEKQLAAAIKLPANTDELLDVRDRQIAQARAQMRLGKR